MSKPAKHRPPEKTNRKRSLNGNFKDRDLYIALSSANLDWFIEQVLDFIRLWNEEYEIDQIAKYFKRSEFECFLLYCDLCEADKIKPREYGLWRKPYRPEAKEA